MQIGLWESPVYLEETYKEFSGVAESLSNWFNINRNCMKISQKSLGKCKNEGLLVNLELCLLMEEVPLSHYSPCQFRGSQHCTGSSTRHGITSDLYSSLWPARKGVPTEADSRKQRLHFPRGLCPIEGYKGRKLLAPFPPCTLKQSRIQFNI